MFISYQKVRNTVVGTTTAAVAGIAAMLGIQGNDPSPPTVGAPNAVAQTAAEEPIQAQPLVSNDTLPNTRIAPVVSEPFPPQANGSNVDAARRTSPTRTSPRGASPRGASPRRSPARNNPARNHSANAPLTNEDRYRAAMELALAEAEGSFSKDALGGSSPWKLNLYDDNGDHQWDRAKLDVDRDDVDDEKWNFKNGVWEKDGGRTVWMVDRWSPKPEASSSEFVGAAPTVAPAEPLGTTEPVDSDAARYEQAMKLANARADATGKGKDVLGSSSPWKLNLYDDNRDGQWDRAKLDYDRDDVDDEKWNFKQGRWEKDGGATIWVGDAWVSNADTGSDVESSDRIAAPVDPLTLRYRKAMKIATGRAASSGKGKDVLGPSSPWKLNLYDDDGDGRWDRAKLDYDRDETDDEKWNFKGGRWEKDGGATVWTGEDWAPAG